MSHQLPPTNPVAIQAFMRAFGISMTAVAAEAGIPSVALKTKLSPAYRNKLNASDEAGIKRYFQRLHAALGTFLDADLAELPEGLSVPEIVPKNSPVAPRVERLARKLVNAVPEAVTTLVLTRENNACTLRYSQDGTAVTEPLTKAGYAALALYFPAPTVTSAGNTATSTRIRLLRRFKLDMLLS